MSRLRGVCPPAAAHNALFSPHGRHGGRGAAEEAGGWQSQGGRRLRRDGGGEAGGSAVSEAAGRSGATAGLGCGTRREQSRRGCALRRAPGAHPAPRCGLGSPWLGGTTGIAAGPGGGSPRRGGEEGRPRHPPVCLLSPGNSL